MLRAALAGGLIATVSSVVMSGSLQAQSSGVEQISGGEIEEIVIEGTQRIEPATVRSYLLVDPGDRFDPGVLNETLRTLFDTGLFADVRLSRENDRLIVEVDENPIINRIAFEGNSEIDDETLRAEVELRPRVVFTRTKVQNDVARLTEVYRRNGHFGVQIEPTVVLLEQNRVDLVFEIDEGPKTRIESINFIGNRAFSDGTLRGEIVSTEAAWWRILGAQDSYDPDRLGFDRELLRRFYLTEGYADFRVDSVTAELTPDRESFIATVLARSIWFPKFRILSRRNWRARCVSARATGTTHNGWKTPSKV
jgi:outer membrane protein insertion porin family